jgi:CRP/FNR family cyclic AMP-dependent transcriptional regulator
VTGNSSTCRRARLRPRAAQYAPGMEVGELLRGADLFAEFSEDVVASIVDATQLVTLDRNQRLFGAGDEANELYVVQAGRIAIASRSGDGRESVMALMEEGDLFGEFSLFDGGGRSADARALEPSVVVRVPYPPIRALFEASPTLLWNVVGFLSRRLRATDSALTDAVFLDVTGRTAKRLLELAAEHDEFVMPLTQEELASMVGASRERVNKALSAFVRLGWITQTDRRYRITDRVQLERRSR